jgi:hypothetical protein
MAYANCQVVNEAFKVRRVFRAIHSFPHVFTLSFSRLQVRSESR